MEIKFKGAKTEESESGVFNPMSYDGITPRCVCGYELVKEDEKTFRCTGGNHRYNMKEGSVTLDKFGNILLKIPESSEDKTA